MFIVVKVRTGDSTYINVYAQGSWDRIEQMIEDARREAIDHRVAFIGVTIIIL
jgi:hypothetical protein